MASEEELFVKRYEELANVIYNTADNAQRASASAAMAQVLANPQFLVQVKSIFGA